jgi:hypothetical protein
MLKDLKTKILALPNADPALARLAASRFLWAGADQKGLFEDAAS